MSNTKTTGVSFPPELFARIERERGKQSPIKARSAFICEILDKVLPKGRK